MFALPSLKALKPGFRGSCVIVTPPVLQPLRTPVTVRLVSPERLSGRDHEFAARRAYGRSTA